jgi:hypothetical protein
MLGWGGNRVGHIEHARVHIRVSDLHAYAQALDLTVSDVLSRARELQYRLGASEGRDGLREGD